jgi:hypothetical protein
MRRRARRNIHCSRRAANMDIRLISTLTPEDEACVAAAICAVAGQLLDQFSIMYTIRIETTDGKVFHRHHAPDPQIVTSSNLART